MRLYIVVNNYNPWYSPLQSTQLPTCKYMQYLDRKDLLVVLQDMKQYILCMEKPHKLFNYTK